MNPGRENDKIDQRYSCYNSELRTIAQSARENKTRIVLSRVFRCTTLNVIDHEKRRRVFCFLL